MKVKNQKKICPICKKNITTVNNPFRPFCSERCRMIDLGKWVLEDYRIAGEKKSLPDRTIDENKTGDK